MKLLFEEAGKGRKNGSIIIEAFCFMSVVLCSFIFLSSDSVCVRREGRRL